jgi:ABC-type transport system involved in multi-copper enzyme maturation permease subunit
VLFQMTMSVAGEREQDTLTFLLLIPEERRSILWAKWLGPWWRNWPVLAISVLGVVLGLACGLYGPPTALLLLLLPWPLLLMVGGIALWLSVLCRRVLFANLLLVGILGVLFIAHVAAGQQTRMIFSFFIALVGEVPLENLLEKVPWGYAAALALGEQALFLLVGVVAALLALRRFTNREYHVF